MTERRENWKQEIVEACEADMKTHGGDFLATVSRVADKLGVAALHVDIVWAEACDALAEKETGR